MVANRAAPQIEPYSQSCCRLKAPSLKLVGREAHRVLRALQSTSTRAGNCSTFFFSGGSLACGSTMGGKSVTCAFSPAGDFESKGPSLLNFESGEPRFSTFSSPAECLSVCGLLLLRILKQRQQDCVDPQFAF